MPNKFENRPELLPGKIEFDPTKPWKIFHVEDDPTKIIFISSVLALWSSKNKLNATVVLQVPSFAAARRLIPNEIVKKGVDLSIIDGDLPDGTGEDVLKLLARSGLIIPFIFNSARGVNLRFLDNLKMPYEVVSKGKPPESLLDAMIRLLSLNPNH